MLLPLWLTRLGKRWLRAEYQCQFGFEDSPSHLNSFGGLGQASPGRRLVRCAANLTLLGLQGG